MSKIAIIYFSGVGNTKYVASLIFNSLKSIHNVEIFSIEKLPCDFDINNYERVVIGFPTIHSAPVKPIMEFISHLQPGKKKIPIFIFTTCGLYSMNTLRIFAVKCYEKNLIPVMNKSYRCAATDGILLAPFVNMWFYHEKGLDERVNRDSLYFTSLNTYKPNIPRLKLYGIINYPNKWLGQHFRIKIYLHNDKCIKCGRCIKNCPTKAFQKNDQEYLTCNTNKCINCYRCIHHCPQLALSLSKRKTPQKTLFIH